MKELTVSEQQQIYEDRRVDRERRVPSLVSQFNGAIKYTPMLQDHPDWTDEQCLAFAREQHAIAAARHAKGDPNWNRGIPYCRNQWKEPSGA